MMKKTTADFKSEGENTGYTIYMVNSFARIKKGNGRLGNRPQIRWIRQYDEGCGFEAQRKRNMDLHAACMVNCCWGKNPGVLFRVN